MKNKVFHFTLLLLGITGIALFLTHMLGFKPHDYFFISNPEAERYVGTNIVSMFADLSFFTYHTLIFFSVWLILFSVSEILGLKRINNYTRDAFVIAFVCANYIFTAIMYTGFELASDNITFGLYANTPKAIYNFVTNIIVHYGYFILSIAVLLRVRTKDCKTNKKRRLCGILIPILYLFIYYTVVKITGMNSYKIIWYPYPIFDASDLASVLALGNLPDYAKNILLAAVICVLLLVYLVLYQLLILFKSRQSSASKINN